MQQLIRVWGYARKRLMAMMLICSVVVHAAIFAYIITRSESRPSTASEYMMVDLTSIPEQPEADVMPEPDPVKPEASKLDISPKSQGARQESPSHAGIDHLVNSPPAPVQLAMLKIGVKSDAALIQTRAVLNFDESPVRLISADLADGILAATHKPIEANGLGGRGSVMRPVIGTGGGGMGGDCK